MFGNLKLLWFLGTTIILLWELLILNKFERVTHLTAGLHEFSWNWT